MRDHSVDPALALPDYAAVVSAAARIAPHVHRTPVMTSAALDAEVGARLHFKCENLQKIGAFKARGAVNAVFSLDPVRAHAGVITHSSGNHGAAIAYAAKARGVPAYVVMPRNAPQVKQENVRRQGAKVFLCEPNVAAREAMCAEVQRETGATLVHPFDNVDVIAGQGTAALELLEQAPALHAVVAPCGGGGLLSGTAIATHGANRLAQVFGTEPRNAGDAAAGFRSGHLEPLPPTSTIADGLRTTLSARTLGAIRAHVSDIATCSEESIVRAMRMTWERMKIIIEPSSAVPLACLLEGTLKLTGRNVGVILTGGNVDLERLPWQADRS
jgi:threonine dehydratase